MRFLVDAQLPPALCRWLAARGHHADHVASVGMLAASDVEIARYTEAERAILISKDEDFLLLRLPDRFGLLWLRCGNVTNVALSTWLDERWARVEQLLADGERLIELR